MRRKARIGLALAAFAPTVAAAQDASEEDAPGQDSPGQASVERHAGASASGVEAVDGRQVYRPAYFDEIVPQTAADMLFEVPGFTVRGGGGGRGLGQGGTNVLINGERVSGKGTGPVDILRRTPAASVLRIEVVDAAALGIPGLTGQVADVYVEQGGLTGNWRWSPTFRENLKPAIWDGAVSLSGERGGVSFTLGLENQSFRRGNQGPETVRTPDGLLTERRFEDGQFYGDRTTGTLALAWDRDNGHDANLNASYGVFFFERDSRRDSIFPDGRRVTLDSGGAEDEWEAEVSGDYALDALGGRLKVIALQSFEHSPIVRFATSRVGDASLGGSFFDQVIDEGESILRAEQGWARESGATWELAAEGAFNFLESEDAFGGIAPDGTRTGSSGAPVRVEELRGQASLAHGRAIGPLDAQASLGIEASEISQPGGGQPPKTLIRPFGFVSAAMAAGEDTDVRFRLERRVGQLNFFDFVSSVNLVDGVATAGNPDIVPQQSWFVQAEAEHRFGPETQVTLRAFYEAIEDRVETVPLPSGGDGPGNVEEASRYGASLTGTLALEPFGLDGGEVDFAGAARESEIIDPVTGVRRGLGGELIYEWSFDFRQDVPGTAWAWGFGASDRREEARVRRVETDLRFEDPETYAFVSHRDVYGARVTVRLGNLLDEREGRRREVYADLSGVSPGRGPLLFTEKQSRTFGQTLTVRIEGTF